jgi:two-component system invasion response regulator UvrY
VVLKAYSGDELLEKINSLLPDIVLTDLKMPGMNGYQVIHALKKKYPEVKTMAVSMFDNKDCLIELMKAGAEGFISKTCEEPELKTALSKLIRQGYYFADNSMARTFNKVAQTGNTKLIEGLSDEEIRFLKLICTDKSYKEIASTLNTSERHVEYMRDRLSEKFGIEGRTRLALYAVENGLIL